MFGSCQPWQAPLDSICNANKEPVSSRGSGNLHQSLRKKAAVTRRTGSWTKIVKQAATNYMDEMIVDGGRHTQTLDFMRELRAIQESSSVIQVGRPGRSEKSGHNRAKQSTLR